MSQLRPAAFFYHGDSATLRYMQRTTEAALGVGSGNFLDRFKALGWFLDDLVLTPVNNLKNPAERKAQNVGPLKLASRIA